MKNCFSKTNVAELVEEINTYSQTLKNLAFDCECRFNPTEYQKEKRSREFDFYFSKLKEFNLSVSNIQESIKKDSSKETTKALLKDLAFAYFGFLITYFVTDSSYISGLCFVLLMAVFVTLDFTVFDALNDYYQKHLKEIKKSYSTYYRTFALYKRILMNPYTFFDKHEGNRYINGQIPMYELDYYTNDIHDGWKEKYPIDHNYFMKLLHSENLEKFELKGE